MTGSGVTHHFASLKRKFRFDELWEFFYQSTQLTRCQQENNVIRTQHTAQSLQRFVRFTDRLNVEICRSRARDNLVLRQLGVRGGALRRRFKDEDLRRSRKQVVIG